MMYLNQLSISDSEVENSPNLHVALIDNPGVPDTIYDIAEINDVLLEEENIGTEESPRNKVTWNFLHREDNGRVSGLSFTVIEGNPIAFLESGHIWASSRICFRINPGSNVIQIINDTFDSIRESVQELKASQPIQTPPIQMGNLTGGKIEHSGKSFVCLN
jgi:hypothetical protein